MIWKIGSRGTEHYQVLWKIACSSKSLHSVTQGYPRFPKFPIVQEVPLACMQFHKLTCSYIILQAVTWASWRRRSSTSPNVRVSVCLEHSLCILKHSGTFYKKVEFQLGGQTDRRTDGQTDGRRPPPPMRDRPLFSLPPPPSLRSGGG